MMEQAVVDGTRPLGDVTIIQEKLPCDLWPLECVSECCPVLPLRCLNSMGTMCETSPAPPFSASGAPYRLMTLFLKITGDVAAIIMKYLTFHFDS